MQRFSSEILVEVLEGGKLPTKAHLSDAGWDVYATSDIAIYPGEVLKHPLNIRLNLPAGTWLEITSKSGLGAKGLLVYAGVIDEAYRGIPHVVMTNVKLTNGMVGSPSLSMLQVNTDPIIIKAGDKLAQMIINPYQHSEMIQVDSVDTNTDRGGGGFGSTGV